MTAAHVSAITPPDPVGRQELPAYPINLNLQDRSCLLVGAGVVAARKAEGLIQAGAAVTVVAPRVSAPVRQLAHETDADGGVFRIFQRRYQRGEAASYRLVITTTDDAAVNHQVFADCEAANVWCNSADDLANCSFILPNNTRGD